MADYVLAIKIDDTELNKAIQKLQAVFKNIDISGTGGGSSGGKVNSKTEAHQKRQSKAFDKIQSVLGGINKKQLALTGMSFALGGIFGLLTDISPLIQSTLKMLTTGIMLMLKPIADFIGLLFRPIMVLFLQYVVLPFYKTVYPWFTKVGMKLGDDLAALVKLFSPAGADETGVSKALAQQIFLDSVGQQITRFFQEIAAHLGQIIVEPFFHAWNQINEAWQGLLSWIDTNMIKALANAWSGFTDWIESGLLTVNESWNNLVGWFENIDVSGITEAWDNVTGFIIGMGEGVNSFVAQGWIKVTAFISKIGSDAQTWVTDRWNEVTKFFSIIASDAGSWLADRWRIITNWFASMASDATGWLKQTWNSITNFFISIANSLQTIWNKFLALLSSIGARSSGSSSSGNNVAKSPWDPDRSKRNALGGIITEPIMGLGLRTGTKYTFGETGSEMITPMNKVGKGSGRSIIINVTVTNQAQLDALIAKVKQELLIDQRRISVI